MTKNLSAPENREYRRIVQFQLEASGLLAKVKRGEMTREQVAAIVDGIQSDEDREELRRWLNHYRHIITPPEKKTPFHRREQKARRFR